MESEPFPSPPAGRVPTLARVAFVSNSARGEYTGRRRWIEPLRRAGLDVSFVLPDGEDWYVERMRSEGIEVLTYRLDRSGLNPRKEYLAARSLLRALRTREFDLVHAFGHKANVYTAYLAPRLRGARVCQHVTGMGSSFTHENPTLRDRAVRMLVRGAYHRWSARVDRIYFQNSDDMRELPDLPPEKVVLTAGTGVDVAEFDPHRVSDARREALRSEFGLSHSDVVFVFVGRLLADKGIRELLQAIDTLHPRWPQMKLLLVGQLDPGNRSGLSADEMARYREHPALRVLGRREDVREILAVSDVFVNPSYREGLPRTQIEAMAMQLPVLACDVPGSRETVERGTNGWLVPARETDALVTAFESLLADPEQRRRMGHRGREIACARFSVDRVTTELVTSYAEFLPGLATGSGAA